MMNRINEFRDKLLNDDYYQIAVDQYVEHIKNIDSIVIWGSASTGQTVFNFLQKFELSNNVQYFADNHKLKWGTKQNGLSVLSAEEVVALAVKNPNTYIIIAATHLMDIKQQLLSLGIKESMIDIRGFGLARDYFTFENKSPYQLINEHFDEYEKVYSYLSDERSRTVYLGILNSKISLDNKHMKGIASNAEGQYFEKELIRIHEGEVFCDCGSFNGDTLETFVKISGGKYKKYIAIEADKDNYTQLTNKINANKYKDVRGYNLACWNERTVLSFHQAQTAGHVTETGGISVQADALDHILQEEEVTFIKMDIEGAEEMALKGAVRVIQKNKPILAVCLYHSLEDCYTLPLLIKEIHQDYSLFVRHYTDMVDLETVCYAIPKERLQ